MAGRLRRLWMPQPPALLADATILTGPESAANAIARGTSNGSLWQKFNTSPMPWQDEAWGYYDAMGMFRNGIGWKSGMVSRVRLRAARKESDNDEPTILDTGPAADIVASITASTQMQIMGTLELQISVPGEGYLVGETQLDGSYLWQARSKSELRYRPLIDRSPWEIVDEKNTSASLEYRRLANDSLVVRVHRPHPRFKHLADSASRAAITTLRRLELIGRYMDAHFLSRIASAGLVVFPAEVQFPVREEFAGLDDAFVREFIEIAAESIGQPGSASAAIPMPITVPGEYSDKVHHVDFTSKFDLRIIEKFDQTKSQLAIDLDCPPEALLGMSDANHWTGWLIDEESFKRYLAPDVEIICGDLTEGLLQPMLQAMRVDDPDVVMWYDASEIIQRPDKSQNAITVYGLGELTGEALRRETGFDEDDAPDDEELSNIVLFKLATNPTTGFAALEALTGTKVETPQTVAPPRGPAVSGDANTPPQQGPPDGPTPPPNGRTPTEQAAAGAIAKISTLRSQLEALERMARLPHAARYNSVQNTWQVLHPVECEDRLNGCPLNWAHWQHTHLLGPGTSGVYTAMLDEPSGTIRVGQSLTDADVATMLPTMSRASG